MGDEASTTEMVIVEFWSPSTASSLIPVTVTVCGVFQLLPVKVKVDLSMVASPVSEAVRDRTTSDAGTAPRTTVKVAVVPDSATVRDVGETVMLPVGALKPPGARLPEESNLTRNISLSVKLRTPSPGS